MAKKWQLAKHDIVETKIFISKIYKFYSIFRLHKNISHKRAIYIMYFEFNFKISLDFNGFPLSLLLVVIRMMQFYRTIIGLINLNRWRDKSNRERDYRLRNQSRAFEFFVNFEANWLKLKEIVQKISEVKLIQTKNTSGISWKITMEKILTLFPVKLECSHFSKQNNFLVIKFG